MSANYRCPDCDQVIPVMDLDEGAVPHCPSCQGATRAGAPPLPAPAEPAPLKPGLPETVTIAPIPPTYDEEPNLDIRRRGTLPHAPPPRPTPTGNGAWKFGGIGVVAVIMGLRVIAMIGTHHHQVPPQPIHIPQVQFQPMPPPFPPPQFPGGLGQLPGLGAPAVQKAAWSAPLDAPLFFPTEVMLSASQQPLVGLAGFDLKGAHFYVFDGTTGAAVGHLRWNIPNQVRRASLSLDGSRVAILLQSGDLQRPAEFQVYALPKGEQVLPAWRPYAQLQPDLSSDLWFALLGPDRLLTVLDHKELALWTPGERRPKYAIPLPMPESPERRAVALSPDRRTLAVAHRDGGFTLHDTATGAIRGRIAPIAGKVTAVRDLAFSPDGMRLGCLTTFEEPDPATCIWFQLWSVPNGERAGRFKAPEGTHWVFWDDAHILVKDGNVDNQRALYEIRTGARIRGVGFNLSELPLVSGGNRVWYLSENGPGQFVQKQFSAVDPPAVVADGQDWMLTPEGITTR